jgi:hypothetical protein
VVEFVLSTELYLVSDDPKFFFSYSKCVDPPKPVQTSTQPIVFPFWIQADFGLCSTRQKSRLFLGFHTNILFFGLFKD